MTQIEFDAAMKQFNYDQMIENQSYNDQKESIDTEINGYKLQIEELKTKILQLHIKKLAVQGEQKKNNQRWHEKKHQFVISHPKDSMEAVQYGHAIQEEAV